MKTKITKHQGQYIIEAIAKSAPNIPTGFQEQDLQNEL